MSLREKTKKKIAQLKEDISSSKQKTLELEIQLKENENFLVMINEDQGFDDYQLEEIINTQPSVKKKKGRAKTGNDVKSLLFRLFQEDETLSLSEVKERARAAGINATDRTITSSLSQLVYEKVLTKPTGYSSFHRPVGSYRTLVDADEK